MKITQQMENEYLQAYLEVFQNTEEFAAMSKKELREHLELELQAFREQMTEIKGRIETAKQFGIEHDRFEQIAFKH